MCLPLAGTRIGTQPSLRGLVRTVTSFVWAPRVSVRTKSCELQKAQLEIPMVRFFEMFNWNILVVIRSSGMVWSRNSKKSYSVSLFHAMMVFWCVNSSRLKSLVIQPNATPDVKVFVGMIKVYKQLNLRKGDYSRCSRWIWFNQLKNVKNRAEEEELPWGRRNSARGIDSVPPCEF